MRCPGTGSSPARGRPCPVDRRAGNAVPGVAEEPVWLRTAEAEA